MVYQCKIYNLLLKQCCINFNSYLAINEMRQC